jgi:hypothetical protein
MMASFLSADDPKHWIPAFLKMGSRRFKVDLLMTVYFKLTVVFSLSSGQQDSMKNRLV